MDTQDVAAYTVKNGGGTFYSFNGRIELWEGKDEERAWAVAYAPLSPYRNLIFDLYGNNANQVCEHVWDFLKRSHSDGSLFGTWIDYSEDPYNLYVDHVFVTTKSMALELAAKNSEKAIYNLVTKEEVRL